MNPLPLPPAVHYANRFGAVEVTPVTDFMPLAGIRKTHPMAQAHVFDLTTAEQIALVTENRRVQVCVHYPLDGLAYLVLHDSPSTAAICRVDVKASACDKAPGAMLEALNRGR